MELRSRLPAIVQGAALVLFFGAFISIQALIGGTRLIFSLPAYATAGLGGILLLLLLRQPRPAPCRACLVVTAIAFAYLLVRAIISPAPFIAQSDIYSMLGALVVYLAFSLLLTSNPARILFLAGLFLFALLHVFVGAIQFREGNNFMPISWLQRADYGARASGFYVCPNHLAGLLEVLGAFALSIACWSRWPSWARLLSGYAAACSYVGLIITGSRGGYVSAAASFLAFGILSLVALTKTNARIFWRAAGLGLIGAIIFAGLVTFGVTQSRFLIERAGNVVDKTNVRRELWHAALQQCKLAPILGTGSATYLYYGRYFRTPGMDRDPVYVHNDYLQLLAEYGLAGALAIGAVIVVHARRGLRSFARLGPKRVAISHQLFSNGLALNVGALASL
ncbi:MAG TPA: O-antigen ligase family protein, partial [Chthoniobacterales bacterium]